jgi:formate dehydrogenase major subunit
MFYPDYQRVASPNARERFEQLWGVGLDPDPGLTVVEIMNAAKKREIRGMYVMGETRRCRIPMSITRARRFALLDHLVVQDIFLTETAYLADVILPATAWPEKNGTVTNTDRMVQLGRKALEAPGDAREDLWIINELGRRSASNGTTVIRARCSRRCARAWTRSPHYLGSAQRESSVTYPCEKEGDPGQPVVFVTRFRPSLDAASSCPPISSPPRSVRMPSIRWCSSRGVSSSTGTLDP